MSNYSYLATPSKTIEVLSNFGLSTKKSLGQNFLVNDAIIGKILELSQVSSGDVVLEVGPGIGTLTCAMLDAGARVISVERDTRLYDVLPETLNPWITCFSLVKKDALDVTCDDICFFSEGNKRNLPNKFVANLPYAVAATLVLKYFQEFDFLKSATVMVQREVAQRISAKVGSKNYGAYSAKLAMYAQCSNSFLVGPNNFMPAPHVDSEVIRLDRVVSVKDNNDVLSTEELKSICTVADAAFASRRKTILNSFKAYFSSSANAKAFGAQEIQVLLSDANIDSKRRGETLSKEEFITLGLRYHEMINS